MYPLDPNYHIMYPLDPNYHRLRQAVSETDGGAYGKYPPAHGPRGRRLPTDRYVPKGDEGGALPAEGPEGERGMLQGGNSGTVG